MGQVQRTYTTHGRTVTYTLEVTPIDFEWIVTEPATVASQVLDFCRFYLQRPANLHYAVYWKSKPDFYRGTEYEFAAVKVPLLAGGRVKVTARQAVWLLEHGEFREDVEYRNGSIPKEQGLDRIENVFVYSEVSTSTLVGSKHQYRPFWRYGSLQTQWVEILLLEADNVKAKVWIKPENWCMQPYEEVYRRVAVRKQRRIPRLLQSNLRRGQVWMVPIEELVLIGHQGNRDPVITPANQHMFDVREACLWWEDLGPWVKTLRDLKPIRPEFHVKEVKPYKSPKRLKPVVRTPEEQFMLEMVEGICANTTGPSFDLEVAKTICDQSYEEAFSPQQLYEAKWRPSQQ